MRRAKELGDRLIVAINGDEMVASYKRRPFLSEQDRLEVVKACRYVDDAFIIHEYDNKEYIKNMISTSLCMVMIGMEKGT